MNTTNYIRIFRGDDSDALGYQTIVGTIKTDLDLTGCKAVFRFLGFYAEFNPIPEDKKLTIVIPAQASRGFPPGVGYASLKVFDSLDKIRTFTNRIPVIVDTMTPSCGCGEFEVSFSPFPELEPLNIFIGPNASDFDQYTGFVSKIIDRASLVKYGLAILADAMSEDGGSSGKAASPLAVKAAYDAIINELTNNYYNAQQTEEAIDRVAAYYITRNAAGDAFETKAQLNSTTVFYSGGKVRVPTRNDYCVVLADETHDNAEYRYIYAVADGQTTGSWQPQFPVGGVMTVDQTVQKNSPNPVSGGGVWSALWGTATTAFSSIYDWCVSQLAGKASKAEVDPLLFAQYYPEGNVKSAAEFTQGIKYTFDTTNHTATVKPFCNTGTAANDNSNLSGRVVIPPFVDASGNGYISDDGTRFKVVGVSAGRPNNYSRNLTAIIAPSTVTTIRDRAFNACTALASVSLPAAASIGDGAFLDCASLASVSLPAAASIGGSAFGYCASLTSVSLPAAASIGDGAFEYCFSLASVDFGDTPRSSVPSLGGNAFVAVPATCKIIVPYTQYDAWIAAYGWKDLPQEFVRHAEKADKPATFTAGDLAGLDQYGNLTDSGIPSAVVPSAATAQNPLVDTATMNSSIATNTATFRGTYNLVSDLSLTTAATHEQVAAAIAAKLASLQPPVVPENNDYCFVQVPTADATPTEISRIDRYKCTVTESSGTTTRTWEYEFSLNNSSFTSAQWAAINSGITSGLVAKLGALPTAEALAQALAGKLGNSGDQTITSGTQAIGFGFDAMTPWIKFTDGNGNTIYAYQPSASGSIALTAGTGHEGNLAALDANGNPTDALIPASNVALKGEIPYSLGTPTVIDTASSETVEGETVNYGVATLVNRTANIVQVTAATALDELRITFPAATSGKVRDFGLRVEIGTGSAALTAPALVPIAPTGETIKIENADGTIPELADGTATAKGATLLYFSETAPGVFVVKGEQVEEVA